MLDVPFWSAGLPNEKAGVGVGAALASEEALTGALAPNVNPPVAPDEAAEPFPNVPVLLAFLAAGSASSSSSAPRFFVASGAAAGAPNPLNPPNGPLVPASLLDFAGAPKLNVVDGFAVAVSPDCSFCVAGWPNEKGAGEGVDVDVEVAGLGCSDAVSFVASEGLAPNTLFDVVFVSVDGFENVNPPVAGFANEKPPAGAALGVLSAVAGLPNEKEGALDVEAEELAGGGDGFDVAAALLLKKFGTGPLFFSLSSAGGFSEDAFADGAAKKLDGAGVGLLAAADGSPKEKAGLAAGLSDGVSAGLSAGVGVVEASAEAGGAKPPRRPSKELPSPVAGVLAGAENDADGCDVVEGNALGAATSLLLAAAPKVNPVGNMFSGSLIFARASTSTASISSSPPSPSSSESHAEILPDLPCVREVFSRP